MPKADNRPTN